MQGQLLMLNNIDIGGHRTPRPSEDQMVVCVRADYRENETEGVDGINSKKALRDKILIWLARFENQMRNNEPAYHYKN
jgi:hypothetical protein